jgi:hypothetical protein
MVASGRPLAPGRRMRSRRVLAVLAALIVVALSTAGCVSMPTGGPVQSYPITQGPGAQSNPYVQIQPLPPGTGWSPQQIVQGFLTAAASFGNYSQVALQYLTPQEQQTWSHPTWSAVVYKSGPYVSEPVYPPAAKDSHTTKSPKGPTTATVRVAGTIQATLKGNGNYKVPSAATTGSSSDAPPPFQLVKLGSQWRISSAPPEVLLTSYSFQNDYQLLNLYFFDPTGTYLVPDPIYVPLRAPGDLMNGLVQDLITPPADWLSGGATKTSLPAGTKISDVTLDGGLAVVNLTGTIAKNPSVDLMQRVSSQLLWTLSGAGQSGSTGAVQSVEVELNGHPWTPPNSQQNPVQQKRQSKQAPAAGTGSVYYYVDSAGYLTSRQGTLGKTVRVEAIGTVDGQQVAVSPNGRWLAVMRGSTLYTGLVGGTLDKRGSGYASMSWDANDDLWTSLGGQVVMFRDTVTVRQPLGHLGLVPVDVISSYGVKNVSPTVTALRIAPDGVRVALVIANTELTFGAIAGQQGQNPQITLSQVQLSPLGATGFTGLTWYGPDNVITLAQPGPAATEYPVSGGNPTPIPVETGMETITASSGNLLIAGLSNGHMVADASLTGAWMSLGAGDAPTYPG